MKFCDKLAKLRKQNNITQEQLAEKMGLSRQAVSKWELGVSIPDMEKILELCNILNCNLDELLDDGVISDNKSIDSNSKINFSNYLKDFLKYITNTYNMFYSMTFKQKIKCFFEMTFIFLILLVLLLVIYNVINNLIFDSLYYLPVVGNYLYIFLDNITIIGAILIGIIVFFHLFKIRYLDYYITIEDKNTFEKIIEKSIDEEKSNKKYIEKEEKEKIIIRDPKHSTFSFFEFLSKILIFITKIFVLFSLLFVVLFFVLFLILFFFLFLHFKFGIIFLYLTICALGIILLTYIILEMFYNFLISKKQHFKRIFIIAILGFIVFGFGFSTSVFTYLNFDNNYNFNTKEKVFEIEIDDYTILTDDNYFNMDANYIIDNTRENIKVEVSYPENMKIYLNSYKSGNYKTYLFFFDLDFFDSYKVLLDSIKKGEILDLNLRNYYLTIYLSEDNYQKLINNKKNYEEDINTYYMK